MEIEIPLYFHEEYAKRGIPKYILWNPANAAHLAIYGATGSGKTVAMKVILARISKYIPDSQFWLNDYKGDEKDFGFLDGCERFYRFDEVEKGLQDFYMEFRRRQSRESNRRISFFSV